MKDDYDALIKNKTWKLIPYIGKESIVEYDVIVRGNDSTTKVKWFINELNVKFALKDMGVLRYFLGVEVKRYETVMFLSQTKYVADILKKFSMLHATPCTTPMVSGRSLSANDGEMLKDPSIYRSEIGALQYLTQTRPDIAFFVNKTSYSDADWAACPDDRRSVGGYCVFFGNTLFSWNSRKQRVVLKFNFP
ncbi:uncharacterized protein LOC114738710 [Neltuma alba]|uniref:uncharacterized protein LOC114738710 n=1 Tax=Neltuma alba TaxID=207710 RepID=UPI0010A382B5|nr:uncharacterized protein LOC114738710 [Prosopis alba]